jgi:hypothetical protein
MDKIITDSMALFLESGKDSDRVAGSKKAKKTMQKQEGKKKVNKKEEVVKAIKQKGKIRKLKNGMIQKMKKDGTWGKPFNPHAVAAKVAGYKPENNEK